MSRYLAWNSNCEGIGKLLSCVLGTYLLEYLSNKESNAGLESQLCRFLNNDSNSGSSGGFMLRNGTLKAELRVLAEGFGSISNSLFLSDR